MNNPSLEGLTLTPDGGLTLWSKRYGQHYHNRNGALLQARHIFVEASHSDRHPAPQILEIGFGLGLNFLTTLERVEQRGVSLHYLAYEFDPQPVEVLQAITASHPCAQHPLWLALLKQWPGNASRLQLGQGRLNIEIRFMDASTDDSKAALPDGWATAVYLDGFSPKANPELWSPAFLQRLASSLQAGGWLSTYSAAGAVRRGLQQAGLSVDRRPGVAGKQEFLSARKPDEPNQSD